MDITSSVMCLGVACIGMKSEKYVLYWWRFRRSVHEVKRNWKKDTQWAGDWSTFGGVQRYANSRKVTHDGSDNFDSIQIAYDAGLLTYSG